MSIAHSPMAVVAGAIASAIITVALALPAAAQHLPGAPDPTIATVPPAPAAARPVPSATGPAATPATEVIDLADIEKRWPSLGEPQRLAVINHLIVNSHLDLAEKLLADFHPSVPAARNVTLLLRAKLLKARGRLPEAEAVLKQLVDADPKFTAARFDLAQTMFLTKHDDAAREQFQFLLNSTSSADQREAIRQFVTAIDDRRPWQISVFSGVTATTNLSQRNDLFANGNSKGGYGALAGAIGSWRQPLSDTLDLMLTGSILGNGYHDTSYNDLTLTGEAGPRASYDWGSVGVYGTIYQRWLGTGTTQFGHDSGTMSYGARLAAFVRLGDDDRVTLSAPCTINRWEPNAAVDGWTCGAQAYFDHLFSKTTFLRLLGGVERQKSEQEDYGYLARNIGLGMSHELAGGIIVYGQAQVTRREYSGFDAIEGYQRRDSRLDLSLQLSFRDFEVYGLMPSVRYTYTVNRSNIEDRSFDAHAVTVMMTKKF